MASNTELSPLAKLARLITPPPPFTSYEYDGLEYRWKMFVFRPALFKFEAIGLLLILFYMIFFFIGKSRNYRIAKAWLDAHSDLLEEQFSRPDVKGLVSDGYSDFFSFSTGRRRVASLHAVFNLLPRHDLAQMIYKYGRAAIELLYKNDDIVELDFKLFSTPASTGFVWGIVSKEYLTQVKDGRWDLTFTRTTESPLLGPDLCVMTEYADVTESLFKACSFNLAEVLKNPAYSKYFRSLTITDQPRERPGLPIPQDHRERHVLLALNIPPPSKANVTVPLVKAVFNLIDNMETKLSLRPETKAKLKKTRDDLDEQLKREAEAEKKEEAELEKAAAKKKAQEERLAKLSAAEQKKELERDRKRAARRVQGKVSVKK